MIHVLPASREATSTRHFSIMLQYKVLLHREAISIQIINLFDSERQLVCVIFLIGIFLILIVYNLYYTYIKS